MRRAFFYRFRFLKREYMDCAPYRAAAGLCWSTRSLTIMTVVGIKCGAEIEIQCSGEQEQACLDAAVALVKSGLGE